MSLPRAYGPALLTGYLRSTPEDFSVAEQLSFVPGGGGEHLWLRVRKRLWNTMDVAQVLAKAAGLPLRAVGFSGLKDRQAVTEQWFSLHLPGMDDPSLRELPEGIAVLEQVRHGRKLNRGTHIANHFVLHARQVQGDAQAAVQRLLQMQQQGVPNYFGEQRFGRARQNVARATAWLLPEEGQRPKEPNRKMRGLWLSAVRSELFNLVLAERVRQGNWNQLLAGDVLQPLASRGLFSADEDTTSAARIAAGEVHPTGPLVGADGMQPTGLCAALENSVLAPQQALIAALAAQKVTAARRALRLPVAGLAWQQLNDNDWKISMTLPTGAFATTVLAELGEWQTPPREASDTE